MPNKIISFIILLICFGSYSWGQTIINAEKNFEPGDTAFFSLSAEYQGNRGNSVVDQIDVGLATGYRINAHTIKMMGGYSSLLEDNKKILNGGYVQIRHNFDLTKIPIKTFSFYQLQFNDILLLKKRELFGIGIRGHLISKGENFIDIGSGTIYEIEQLDSAFLLLGENNLTKYYRMSNLLSCKLTLNAGISITNVVYYQPWLGDFSDFRLLNDFSISFELYENLSVDLNLVYRYDSAPPSALKNGDLDIGTGITISF